MNGLEFDPTAPLANEGQELIAQMAAARLGASHLCAAMFFALIEKGLVDATRVFAFSQTLAGGLEGLAQRKDAPETARRAHALAADALREFEKVVRGMVTVPTNAGRA
jgi:hypothetical protein